jgi:CheY-like chemotaxis protein
VETRHIPIIVVTANPRPVALTRAVQAGADVALLKPCGPDALLGEAQRLMMSPRGVGAPSYGLEENKRAPAVQPPSPFEPAFKTKRHVTSRTYKRYATSTPSVPPPALRCASCDRSLTYERSEIGGVTPDDPEQWDYYQCPTGCGRFQYRQRTRKLRLA